MNEYQNSNSRPDETPVAIVTGANAGLGFETAKALAAKNFKVIMACRDLEKAEQARNQIIAAHSDALVEIQELDLASLDSVRSFSSIFLSSYKKLDLLINNAGVMMPPYQTTEDGFELQLGVNYLGHFLLTGLLKEALTCSQNSRIISLSSIAHKNAEIDFNDLQSEKSYSKFKAYGQSKLACLIFSLELERRLKAHSISHVSSLAAHPGVSSTELMRHLPAWLMLIAKPMEPFISHSAEKGAQPTLKAALDKELAGGCYIGPDGFREMKGQPAEAEIARQAKNKETAAKLWAVSENLTGIKFLS
ncbi:oxidoreductase [Christiangramia portivictoriae]|uniref:oxidoreductase n=1 Tax=Christiangramia portivictoriae TaxID=326069 RepID=UPI0004123539|nr:oxidoreductase [Christiangramia portivictoriae]